MVAWVSTVPTRSPCGDQSLQGCPGRQGCCRQPCPNKAAMGSPVPTRARWAAQIPSRLRWAAQSKGAVGSQSLQWRQGRPSPYEPWAAQSLQGCHAPQWAARSRKGCLGQPSPHKGATGSPVPKRSPRPNKVAMGSQVPTRLAFAVQSQDGAMGSPIPRRWPWAAQSLQGYHGQPSSCKIAKSLQGGNAI